MSELLAKLNELPSFHSLNEVEAELASIETPVNFNPDDPDQLAAQMERLRAREGLDRATAISAFRLEAVNAIDLLTLTERLATIAAYDPEIVSRHQHNRHQVLALMNPKGKSGTRKRLAEQQRRKAMLLGVEGLHAPERLPNAMGLVDKITEARHFAEVHAGESVGIGLLDGNVITGTLPAPEVSFALSEPIVAGREVEYLIPSSLDAISNLKYFTEKGEGRLDASRYPDLVRSVDGELIANPQLSRLRQELGLSGVNIRRKYYRDDFPDSIVPESRGWEHIFPKKIEVHRSHDSRRRWRRYRGDYQ